MASSKNIQTLTTTTLARLSAFVSNHFDSIAHSRFRTLYQLQCQSIEETKVQTIFSFDFLASKKVVNQGAIHLGAPQVWVQIPFLLYEKLFA